MTLDQMTLDSRRIPARPDLAAAHLKGEVEAGRYAEATPLAVSVPLAPLTARPDGEAPLASQLLHGEGFAAYENNAGWAWGQAESDGHVGIMLDPTRLLHCNAHHMAVAIEPLETARARILAAGGGPVTRHARLDATAGDS